MNSIKNAPLARTIPPVIAENDDIKALGELIQKELQKITYEIDKNKIFCNIEEMDETTLDILAYDLNVLWYDFNYSLKIKREIIKDCIKVYRKLGTPYAVKTAVGNVFPDSKLREWFETNGEPFTFEVEINATQDGATRDLQENVLERIRYYKNLRSHLKKITYIVEKRAKTILATMQTVSREIAIFPYLPENIEQHGKIYIKSVKVFEQTMEVYPS